MAVPKIPPETKPWGLAMAVTPYENNSAPMVRRKRFQGTVIVRARKRSFNGVVPVDECSCILFECIILFERVSVSCEIQVHILAKWQVRYPLFCSFDFGGFLCSCMSG